MTKATFKKGHLTGGLLTVSEGESIMVGTWQPANRHGTGATTLNRGRERKPSSNTLPPARLRLLNLTKQHHKLDSVSIAVERHNNNHDNS